MNILLINPSQENVYGKIGTITQPHIGLAYIGAVLEKEGHCVSLIDMDYDGISYERLGKIISQQSFDIVGITATTPVITSAIRVARTIKMANPSVKVIIGGIHATIMPQMLAKEPAIDFVVRGEGEATIRELVKSIENRTDAENIAGLSYRKDGKIIETPERALIDNLDEIPLPARHLFSKKQYRYPDTLYSPAFAIHTSRGCPGRCTYCQAKNIYGYRVRFRSAESVAEEVEILIKDFKAREIHVWDDNFAANKERIFKIRDEIKRRGISIAFSFTAGIRVDTACDERVLRAKREMGGYSIAFGIESGNQGILDSIGKGITLDQARQAVSLAKKLGFEVWAFFMLGFPDENEQTMAETIAFAKELNPDVAKFHILKPYPGSKIFEEMKQEGLIDDLNYENYGIHTFPVHHTRRASRATIYEYQKRAYRSFYIRPMIVLKQMLRLRSTNRIFNNLRTALGVLRLIGRGKNKRSPSEFPSMMKR